MQKLSRSLFLTALAGTLVLNACAPDQAGLTQPTELAPRSAVLQMAPEGIPGQYVVVYHPDVVQPAAAAQSFVRSHGGTLLHTYSSAIKGFAAELSDEAVQALLQDPGVAGVYQDMMAYPTGTVQPNATWGLDRVDQRNLPLNNSYTYHANGTGVNVYIMDSGIHYSHNEFGGRAQLGIDYINDGRNGGDCNGHGTHVAGTVAGSTYGVAKNANLRSVRVFACSGGQSYAVIIAAVDWVTANHVKPAVTNMSLGGPFFAPLNDAVTASIAAGVHYAVSAGNDGANACNASPASTPNAMTVAATMNTDSRSIHPGWWSSNFGTCVDIFAPGSEIRSAWWTSNTALADLWGTSMASPHVAGALALLLHLEPNMTPAQSKAFLERTASVGRVTNPGTGSPNRLLHTPQEIDVQPGTISLSNTAAVNVVLISRPDFDATAVNAANARLWIGNTPVAPIMRGANAVTSTVDFDGDGRIDRIISFRTSDLVAAGLNTTRRDIGLRWTTGADQNEARDLVLPVRVP